MTLNGRMYYKGKAVPIGAEAGGGINGLAVPVLKACWSWDMRQRELES